MKDGFCTTKNVPQVLNVMIDDSNSEPKSDLVLPEYQPMKKSTKNGDSAPYLVQIINKSEEK